MSLSVSGLALFFGSTGPFEAPPAQAGDALLQRRVG